jgi:glycosyltransferase involved in cell wall biosynthesis
MGEIVTIIIAAYGRVEALNRTLRSVLLQSYPHWRVLIVADCCSEEYLSAVNVEDDRIRILNLPERCGHQYGPNSIGLQFSDSKFVAFLNHDDIWLSDHLEEGLKQLRDKQSNFFIGQAAFVMSWQQYHYPEQLGRLIVSETNNPYAIWRCLTGPWAMFEPASSWIVHTDLALKVGHWRSPDQLKTTPLLDWLTRSAREGAQFCFSDLSTVMKLNLHNGPDGDGPHYERTSPFDKYLEKYFEKTADEVRVWIANDLAHRDVRGVVPRDCNRARIQLVPEEYPHLLAFLLYLRTGVIPFSPGLGRDFDELAKMAGMAPTIVKSRTDEVMQAFPEVESILAKLELPTRGSSTKNFG